MVFVSWLVHAYLSADCSVEVVAAPVNPGVIGPQLHSRDVMRLRNALAGVALLHCVR